MPFHISSPPFPSCSVPSRPATAELCQWTLALQLLTGCNSKRLQMMDKVRGECNWAFISLTLPCWDSSWLPSVLPLRVQLPEKVHSYSYVIHFWQQLSPLPLQIPHGDGFQLMLSPRCCPIPVVSLNPAQKFVKSSFIRLSPNYCLSEYRFLLLFLGPQLAQRARAKLERLKLFLFLSTDFMKFYLRYSVSYIFVYFEVTFRELAPRIKTRNEKDF